MTETVGRSLSYLASIDISQLKAAKSGKSALIAGLKALGIETALDLVSLYPRSYEDMTKQVVIREAKADMAFTVVGEVSYVSRPRYSANKKPIVEVRIEDDTASLTLIFFNQKWRSNQLKVGQMIRVYGKVTYFGRKKSIINPVVDILSSKREFRTGKIIPVYPASAKESVSSETIRKLIKEIFERSKFFVDPINTAFLERHGLISRDKALRLIHEPENMTDCEKARRRLAFDELLRIEIPLLRRRQIVENQLMGFCHQDVSLNGGNLVSRFLEELQFNLTEDQMDVLKDILSDMARKVPMHRLVQGDVGTGKTVVGIIALLTGVQNGYQGAFMAPTEVLAEQHYKALVSFCWNLEVEDETRLGKKRPLKIECLTSSTTSLKREKILNELINQKIDILVGTHALLSDEVKFKNLSIVVIDEQHRFGVEQRYKLRLKSNEYFPDTLVMTATPIPRTAAMVLYGDLDLSVIKKGPSFKREIITKYLQGDTGEKEAFDKVRQELEKGNLAYVICPMVDDSSKSFSKNVISEKKRLERTYLAGFNLEVLHGQLSSKKKDEIMLEFKKHEVNVLVATTVVEVGIDVKDATVIVILNADRFGIAQLHQLRGRVGRSDKQSYCFLLAQNPTEEADIRLRALEASTNGFELAEIDLELRGEGSILSARQQGRSDLRAVSFKKDKDLIELARSYGKKLLDRDPNLEKGLHKLIKQEIELLIGEEKEEFVFKS